MSDNVCKFNPSRSGDLICLNFIYEVKGCQAAPSRAARSAVHLVTEGEGIYTCNGHSYPVGAGCVFFVLEGSEFSVASTSSLKYCYISFYGRRAEEYLQRLHILPENCVFAGYERLIPFWLEAHALAEEGNIDVLSEAVLLYTLGVLRPQRGAKSDVTDRVAELTQDRFTDADLSITAVAAELGYDAKYLSSLFKRKRGISYTSYLRDLRLRHAAFLMEQGVVSVKNVAILCGFRDALYFSKLFTAAMGATPKEYIARQRHGECDS